MKSKMQSQEIITPLSYFGQRESIVQDLLNFLPQKKYRTCFDPFSGSGSISFAAMQKDIADIYYINDSFPALASLWEIIKEKPLQIISSYQEIYLGYFLAENKQSFYHEIQQKFNEAKDKRDVVAHFAFLINYGKDNIPLFDSHLNLKCEPNLSVNLTQEQDSSFKFKVLALSEKFGAKKVVFTSKHFEEILEKATPDDIVLFDPPYPAQSSEVYHRLKNQEELQNDLIKCIGQLNEKKIPYIILYGAGPIEKMHQFPADSLNLNHLMRLSYHPLYGQFLEHIYVSNNLGCAQLPKHIVGYDKLFDGDKNSYETAFNNLKNRVNPKEQEAIDQDVIYRMNC